MYRLQLKSFDIGQLYDPRPLKLAEAAWGSWPVASNRHNYNVRDGSQVRLPA